MRRALAAAMTVALVCVPLAPARAADAGGERAYEAQARASVLFANVDVQPEFDPAFADSLSSSASFGSTSRDSAMWPGFLVDAFFFLYGFQSVERVGLGVAEARYPQGPVTSDATLSNLAFTNGGDPHTVPATAGRALGEAGLQTADGDAALSEIAVPDGAISSARSTSAVRTAGAAHGESVQRLKDVQIGPLRIAAIDGSATADAGPSSSSAWALHVIDATVAGTPVTIDGAGVQAQTAGAQDAVDAALASSGLAVRLVPGARIAGTDGSQTASSGGVLVSVTQAPDSATGAQRFELLLGSATAYARAGAVGATFTPHPFGGAPEVLGTQLVPAPPPTVADVQAPQRFVHRRIVITGTASGLGASARGAYLALMLLAFGLLLVRPLVRAAARR